MTRLALALAVWISLVSGGSASLTPRKEFVPLNREVPRVRAAKLPTPAPKRAGARPEFVLTAQTEIWLNGKPCQYREVPADATIAQMEVAEDEKTVLKVHFRTRK